MAADAPAIADVYLESRRAAEVRGLIPAGIHPAHEVREWIAGRVAEEEVWLAGSEGVEGFIRLGDGPVEALYVLPEAHGRGIGSALLRHAQALHPDGLSLWVFATNAPAIAFYARHGFTEAERTDGAGNEEGAPDVRMVWRAVDAS